MSDRHMEAVSTTAAVEPTPTDRLLGRVILGLIVIAVLDVLAITVLAWEERSIPDALVVTLGSAVTGLAGVLAGRRS